MAQRMQPFPGSERAAPSDMRAIGRVPGDEAITISLYLKPVAGDLPAPGAFESRAALAGARSADHADDIAALEAFATASELPVAQTDPARRLVRLSGTAAAMEKAVGTELNTYEGAGKVCRVRRGALHVPANLADRLVAVLGLDTRPIATPKIVPHRGPVPPAGFLPTDIAKLYGFDAVDASGQCIGIIELGGSGTRITASSGAITAEVVWKSNGGGTGGGVSALFAVPAYQAEAKIPTGANRKPGRGVPDIAGDADPDSGYRIVTGGKTEIIGGTSAVAPLWAGIAAGLNAARKTPLGQIHAQLYADPSALRDIVQGENRSGPIGFSARKGWDACTGLGSPNGAKLRALLVGDGK